jgi:cystathionine beta-synthase/cysteine synthase A
MIRDHVTDVVGGTPLVRTHRLLDQGAGELLLKLEESNPTCSVKDRAAFAIVAQAEQDGLLRKGDTLVEATSGNFGRSLAMLGGALGYHVILVVDPKTPDESLRYARAFGAKIDVVDEQDEHGSYQPATSSRAHGEHQRGL